MGQSERLYAHPIPNCTHAVDRGGNRPKWGRREGAGPHSLPTHTAPPPLLRIGLRYAKTGGLPVATRRCPHGI